MFQPVIDAQTQMMERLNETMERVNTTLDTIDTVSPGVVVKSGAREAGRELGIAMVQGAQKDTRVRSELVGLVAGEM